MSRVLLSIGAVQVLIMLVALVRSKVLSVLLGPAGFGVASTVDQTVLTLVNVGSLTLTFTALKFMARSHSEGPAAFRQTYASFFRVLAALSLLTVAVAAAVLWLRPTAFGADLARYRTTLLLGTLGVPAAMLNILFINALAAAQRSTASAVAGLLVATSLAVGAVVGQLAYGLDGLYVGTFVAGAVNTAVTVLYLRRRLGVRGAGPGAGLVHEFRRNPQVAKVAALLYVAMTAYSLTMLATRYVVFSALGEVPAGLLQAVMSLALTVGAVMGPMNNLFLTPLVNRNLPAERKVAAADDFAGKMAVLLLLAALPMALFPDLVLSVLFSHRFAPAAGVLFLFVFWQCLYQLVNVYLQLLIGLDDVPAFCAITCASYGCAAGLFPVLVPRAGLGGVALALAVGLAVSTAGAAVRLRVRFGHRVSGAAAARAACALGAIVLAGYLFPDVRGERTVAGALARVAYALAAAGTMWALLAPAERALVTAGARRVLGARARLRPSAS